uniref:HEAT repeat domain-containing protein n=1 Tax=Anaeromyxobacter oryzisoli TaxID=2925408 RepID=UPI001F590518
PAAADEAPPAGDAPATDARGFAQPGAGAEPLEPLAAALAQALESDDLASLLVDEDVPPPVSAGAEAGGRAPEPASAAERSEPGPEPEPEPESPSPALLDRSAPPRWSGEEARAALDAARWRDEVVVTALRYARDFFEFAALFAVTGDAVVGHDALGPEDARERCRGVAIYTSDPGLFGTVITTRAPHLGPMPRGIAGNDEILDALGRGTPRTALVFPVLLGDRTVAVLYADNGEAPVSPGRLGDLLVLLSTVGAAFIRVIRARKAGRRRRAAPAPAPAPLEPVPPPPSTSVRRGAPAGWIARAPEPAPAPSPPSPARAGPDDPWKAQEPALAVDDIEIDFSDPESLAASAPFDAGATIDALVAAAPGTAARQDAIRRLAGHPAQALSALVARLPGPVESDAPSPSPAELGPIPAALAALGGRAVPALLEVIDDADPDRRRAAAILLGAAADPAAFPALAERALDAEPRVAAPALATLAAHRRDPAMRAVSEKLRRALLSGIGARVAGAARALGALRDVEAIPLLVQVLETVAGADRETAAAALAEITLQRLGTDPRRWLGWWKENRGRGRAEWLFSGLTSPDREVRLAAAAELTEAAAPPVEYSADAPPEELESASRAWAGWWARSGRIL